MFNALKHFHGHVTVSLNVSFRPNLPVERGRSSAPVSQHPRGRGLVRTRVEFETTRIAPRLGGGEGGSCNETSVRREEKPM